MVKTTGKSENRASKLRKAFRIFGRVNGTNKQCIAGVQVAQGCGNRGEKLRVVLTLISGLIAITTSPGELFER